MLDNIKLLCNSRNGVAIYYEPLASHTATHFKDKPELKKIVTEYLSGADVTGDLFAQDVDMGKIIGNSDVVEISSNDEIVYAIRKNRDDQGYVPFIKNRKAEPSTLLSIFLEKKSDATYELLSVWIGAFDSPPFPEMDNATPQSIPYWKTHAFVWGSQQILENTTVKHCPWL